ncbi:VanZ family protein [Paenibacillus popilliae]|uniref:Glycopeptide antibiotics resistance protein n=1 Tax=Paenibacillus popilliae ATCC 14706 TaxID=1212764 RepID=M9L7W8_PAEPP|nr:VanZ family protein [Paenibacillus popilliae]GAC41137.1 glycopeptide antibiotics resistance protein [Paenibacillus popilliae ATCC 14706]
MGFSHIFTHFLEFETFIYLLLLSFFILFIIQIINLIKKKPFNIYIFFVDYFFIFYLLIVSLFVFSNGFCSDPFDIKDATQLIPFKSIYKFVALENYFQITGNTLLLLPFPILLQLRSLKRYKIKQAFLYTLTCSLLIESMQLVLDVLFNCNGKIFDVDDLILNTIGGVMGWLVFKPIFPYFYRLFSGFIKKKMS